MKEKRVIKIRIYPNKRQRDLIDINIRACNFVWNKYIEANNESFKAGTGFIAGFKYLTKLTELKKIDPDFKWLNDANVHAMQHAVQECHNAYMAAFRGTKNYPRFKDRKLKTGFKSFQIRTNERGNKSRLQLFHFRPDKKNLIKISVLGTIRAPRKNLLPSEDLISSGRIIRTTDEKYYVMFRYDYETNDEISYMEKSPGIGIDLGIRNYATIVDENGNVKISPSFLEHDKYKKIDQRRENLLSIVGRKVKINYKRLREDYITKYGIVPTGEDNLELIRLSHDSSNIRKLYVKIRRLYEKRTNYTENYICQLVNKLAISKPEFITIEDLDIMHMLTDDLPSEVHSKITKSSWYKFRTRMITKCHDLGIEIRLADRKFLSSKICSECGFVHGHFRRQPVFKCPYCGITIDRDINAATNLCKTSRYSLA